MTLHPIPIEKSDLPDLTVAWCKVKNAPGKSYILVEVAKAGAQ